ncbi:MAG TPA: hypothetical protein DEF13_07280, partial [Holosporales bacterium]|nr:hypothetical protein [Holosporales bacterium]
DLGAIREPISFWHYNIYLKEGNDLIGRFLFINSCNPGWLETGIYLVKTARQKGFGTEVLSAMLNNVVHPALGKPFFTDATQDVEIGYEMLIADHLKVTRHPIFRGVYAKADNFDNAGSLAVHHRAGYKIQWVNHIPFMLYPSEDHQCLSESHVSALLEITRLFSSMSAMIRYLQSRSSEDTSSVHLDRNTHIGLLKLKEFKEENDQVLENLKTLFETDQPHTLLSALDLWISLDANPEELKKLIFPDKAARILMLSETQSDLYDVNTSMWIKGLISQHRAVLDSLVNPKK